MGVTMSEQLSHRRARRIGALVSAVPRRKFAAAVPPAHAAPESARAAVTYTTMSASTTLVSSTGKKLKISVYASKAASTAQPRMSVGVSNPGGTESHTFSFPKSSLALTSTGAGTADSPPPSRVGAPRST